MYIIHACCFYSILLFNKSFCHLTVGLIFATVAFCNEISNEILKDGSDNFTVEK